MTAQEPETPGQAFHAAYTAARPGDVYTPYGEVSDELKRALETGAQAAIDVFLAGSTVSAESIREALAAQERPAPASDLADDFLFERGQVTELRTVLGEIFTCLDAGDPALLDGDQVFEWRQRAGMDET